MRTLLLLTALCLLVGCAKKTAKNTEPTEVAKAKPQPPTPEPNTKVSKKKDKKDDGPNWIKKKEPLGPNELPIENTPGKPNYGINPLPPNSVAPVPNPGVQPIPQPGPGPGPMPVPNPQPNPMGGPNPPPKPPPGGVLQPMPVKPPVAQPAVPAKRVEKADMQEIFIFINDRSGATGKMPDIQTTYAALVEAKSKAAPLVKDGTIILTGSTQRESVWAYEANALLNGGLVVSQNGVETLTAAQLLQRLQGQ
ncbi:MAG: hypothetical protein L0241_11665 [Planctomycetia bacterium]|nr:hypothetical protein [Planctomycetia bacterium]